MINPCSPEWDNEDYYKDVCPDPDIDIFGKSKFEDIKIRQMNKKTKTGICILLLLILIPIATAIVEFYTGNIIIVDAGEDQNICAGDSVTLTATGGVDFQWNTGE